MRCEIPVLLRCCFCFPLRYGLLAWTYIKQIINIVFLSFNIWKLCVDTRSTDVFNNVVLSALLTSTIVDIVFHILFIVSAHKKDYKKMRIFYRYSIVLLCLHGVIICLFIGNLVYYIYIYPLILIVLWTALLPLLVIYLLLLLSQGYLVILVRSEFLKLKSNSNFEFVNNATEEKCAANIDFKYPIPV